MEALLIYLAVFFLPDRITLWYVLFWILMIGLIAAFIITRRRPAWGKRAWFGLLAAEFCALLWANIASEWGKALDSFTQSGILLARIGVHLYTVLAVISVIGLCCFLKRFRR